jgi:GNAT superfamily N-acetyltransferase
MQDITYRYDKILPKDQVIALYSALKWSSAEKPKQLLSALANSHTVITAWENGNLVGLGNAISDGHLVVYYPHLAVLPKYQGKGIGREIVRRMKEKYAGFHQQSLIADGKAIDFYKKCGFEKAGSCTALWIYMGHDHD